MDGTIDLPPVSWRVSGAPENTLYTNGVALGRVTAPPHSHQTVFGWPLLKKAERLEFIDAEDEHAGLVVYPTMDP